MFLVVAPSHIGEISTVYVIEQTQGYRCTYNPAGFASSATLVCCVLPAALVAVGAALAALVTAIPQLVWLSEHKSLVFGVAGSLLAISGISLWITRRALVLLCPILDNTKILVISYRCENTCGDLRAKCACSRTSIGDLSIAGRAGTGGPLSRCYRRAGRSPAVLVDISSTESATRRAHYPATSRPPAYL
jgi:hypothetical protein